jgi:branched-chain amino acid transport system substrate-binding protein
MRRQILKGLAASALALATLPALAQETVKVGLILPMTGQQASTGRQLEAGVKAYMAQHGNKVAGKTVEVIIKDDTGVADISKRLAQELVVNDKVSVLGGFGLTPIAMAVGPVATQAKVPAVIMTAATSIIVEQSPYFVRVGRTMPQMTFPIADWAAKNGVKTAVTLVSDYAPGIDAEKFFKQRFEEAGGKVLDALRAPLASPDFAAFLQKAKDLKPDALFLFVPSGQGATLMKQVIDRDFAGAKIRVIATGDVTDDDLLNSMGDSVLGMVTSHDYSADHDSPENKAFVEIFKKVNNNMRPNMMAVAAYDGMDVIYRALTTTKGDANGQKLVDAMKGQKWMSPRGPMEIDAATREAIPPMFIRRVERKNGELYNVEFEATGPIKDPTHK